MGEINKLGSCYESMVRLEFSRAVYGPDLEISEKVSINKNTDLVSMAIVG